MAKKNELDTQITPQQVYSAENIAKKPKVPNYAKMSVDKLGETIAKAKNKAELNQVRIMNTPLSMGVITGQAAHMANINNAQINSLANIYDAKNAEITRKEAAEQQKFANDLALKNYSLQEKNILSQIAERGKPKPEEALATYGAGLTRGEGGSVDFADYQRAKDAAIKSGAGITGTDFDNRYGSMLSADDIKKNNIGLTPSQYSTASAATPEVVNSWTAQIQSGQAKLTDIPAAQGELRNQVQVALAQAGNDASGKPTTTEMGTQALKTATELQAMINEGKGTSAVGLSRYPIGAVMQRIPGTDASNLAIKFQSLKDKLSLDAVKYLKGQGQISDAERALLASAVTELNLGQSEEQFKTTLTTIIDKLSGGKANDPLGLRQ